MAGTLITSTIQGTTLTDGTNSTSTTNPIKGSAKAWINYKGTATVSIRASYNVSSVTVNGTGDYTINMTTALADANYAVCTTNGGNSTSLFAFGAFDTTAPTTSAFKIFTVNTSFVNTNSSYVMASVFSS
jgi:hypothetical protein